MSLDTGPIDRTAEELAPRAALTHRRVMGGATRYLEDMVLAVATGAGGLGC